MKIAPSCITWLLGIAFGAVMASGFAQDNVTISRSRLQELERKEAELESLKLKQTAPQPAPAPGSDSRSATNLSGTTSSPPPAVRVTPLLTSLPPLKDQEQVDALDLASHYHAAPAAADKRYRGQKFVLRGEIVGFEKPMFRRDYSVLLKTADHDPRVICSFYPPEKFKAVFTVDHGAGLVALAGETRVPLAKVGDSVILSARCKGCRGSVIVISAAEMKLVSVSER